MGGLYTLVTPSILLTPTLRYCAGCNVETPTKTRFLKQAGISHATAIFGMATVRAADEAENYRDKIEQL